MGLLDSAMKLAGGGGGGSGLAGTVSGLLERAGGIDGLVARFQESGLGDKARSWVGTGDNEDVSPDEVRQALGREDVRRVADEAGVSEDEAASGLAGLLPGLVDRLTPGGQVPDLGALTSRLKGMDAGALADLLR